MSKNIKTNINNQNFTFQQDAYDLYVNYLQKVKNQFSAVDYVDILQDIEGRIVEHLLTLNYKEPITFDQIQLILNKMGDIDKDSVDTVSQVSYSIKSNKDKQGVFKLVKVLLIIIITVIVSYIIFGFILSWIFFNAVPTEINYIEGELEIIPDDQLNVEPTE
jgi:hypothetical protein